MEILADWKQLLGNGMGLLESALHVVIILALTWLLLRLSRKGLARLRTHMQQDLGDRERIKRLDTLERVFRYVAAVIITLVGGMLVLSAVGISIAPILATAGVLGIAIGFGAQSLVKDYFNGFFLLLENQVRQGDVVEIAGKGGLVEEMTLRYIRLRDYEGSVHYIPNGTIDSVTNRSRGFAYAVIDVGVAYREDIDGVYAVMRDVAAELRTDLRQGEVGQLATEVHGHLPCPGERLPAARAFQLRDCDIEGSGRRAEDPPRRNRHGRGTGAQVLEHVRRHIQVDGLVS